MSLIDVDPGVYDAASKVFGQTITNHVTHAFTDLQRALGSTGAMAGADPGGTKWAASYDHAATATFDAMTEANDACFSLAAMLEITGFNHGIAEDHSNPSGRVSTPSDTTAYAAPGEFVCYARPPSAAGGSGSPPHGWGLIQHLVGCMWPNGHQNKLHKAAHAWSSAAHMLDTAARFVPEAVHAVRGQRSPEVDDAVTVCQAVERHIQDISSSCRSLSTACSDFAHYIDKAHHDVEQELVELLEWTAAIETGGALLATVSFGAGEIPAQAAETGRIAATATRVRSIIARLTHMASTSETASNVLTKLAPVEQRLKMIRNVRLSRATTEQVKPLSAITKDLKSSAGELKETGRGYSFKDLDRVTDHLRRPGLSRSPANDAMIDGISQNLAKGRPLSEGEQNFMQHELAEAKLMDDGMSYEQAHELALKTHPLMRNYTPEVIGRFPEWFNNNWRRAWGMEPR